MIFGNGIDAQEIDAVAKIAKRRPRFVDVILTPGEKALYLTKQGKHQDEFLAGRFSVKEAYSKALGTGIGAAVSWQDLEIMTNAAGQPFLAKHPKEGELVAHVSISHTGNVVHSSVILEQRENFDQLVSSHRPAWLEISAKALAHNVKYVRDLTKAKRFFAVVKANAYGHGMNQVVTAALAAKVDGFAVATLDEGIRLRNLDVTLPILVLGISPAEDASLLAKYALIPVVATTSWLTAASEFLQPADKLSVWLAIDTGMGRIGFRETDDLEAAIKLIDANEQLDLHSIGMHFATADGPNKAYFEKQLTRWQNLITDLQLDQKVLLHLANSGTALWHQQPSLDLVRVGAAMYGIDPSQGTLEHRALQPVLSLKAQLVHVKQVAAGESISYGATYTTQSAEWIGTLPIGYADGYARSLQGMTGLLPDGRKVEIVGRIAMDQMMVRLPDEVPVGTVVTLIGQVGDQAISLEDLADKRATIPYEIATSLAVRLPRRLVD
ncbi:alanine racemase [Weissella oryzae SG25]|uniref:Multifunctional fusion protein n=1 Tax=Weissella oryzae (strain DSM 25784 / JCM 18191 / LMG 30913 / SG25) TaxID=1329250 RepID=A0A069CU46_WEIOS|nr:alanine racemase [Weissella oryzae]GAK30917.1 alanine racemase [Weissella oryzae SG25]